MTDASNDASLDGLRNLLKNGNPDMVAARGVIQAVIDGREKGSLTLEDVVVILAGAIANLDRRLVDLEKGRGGSEPTA